MATQADAPIHSAGISGDGELLAAQELRVLGEFHPDMAGDAVIGHEAGMDTVKAPAYLQGVLIAGGNIALAEEIGEDTGAQRRLGIDALVGSRGWIGGMGSSQ